MNRAGALRIRWALLLLLLAFPNTAYAGYCTSFTDCFKNYWWLFLLALLAMVALAALAAWAAEMAAIAAVEALDDAAVLQLETAIEAGDVNAVEGVLFGTGGGLASGEAGAAAAGAGLAVAGAIGIGVAASAGGSEPPPSYEPPVEPPVEPPREPSVETPPESPKPEEPKPEWPEEKKPHVTKPPESKPDGAEKDPEAEKRAQMEEMWERHKRGRDEGPPESRPEPEPDPNIPDHQRIINMILRRELDEIKKRGKDSLESAEATHGSPDTWKFVKEKDGSGGPATGEHYFPGQTKHYDILKDEEGQEFEMHYVKDTDGTIKDVDFPPRSY